MYSSSDFFPWVKLLILAAKASKPSLVLFKSLEFTPVAVEIAFFSSSLRVKALIAFWELATDSLSFSFAFSSWVDSGLSSSFWRESIPCLW